MIAASGLQQRVPPHPVAAYVGTYEHPTLGTIELREVNGRLGMFAEAAGSAVEMFDAARNRLRIQPTSTASVINLEMAHGRAVALTYSGQRFVGR